MTRYTIDRSVLKVYIQIKVQVFCADLVDVGIAMIVENGICNDFRRTNVLLVRRFA
jgi:hypothetical protein